MNNTAILKSMIGVADGIAATIGNNCEVAIHDLTHPQHSIMYIVNGHITGRSAGDCLGPGFNSFLEYTKTRGDSLHNYYSYYNNRSLRCTKVLIRNETDEIIGCLCIAIALDPYLQAKQLIDSFCETRGSIQQQKDAQENNSATEDIIELSRRIIQNTYYDMTRSTNVITKKDKIDMVQFLNERGIFKVKGSVDLVAELLEVSKHTIYLYLDPQKNKTGLEQ